MTELEALSIWVALSTEGEEGQQTPPDRSPKEHTAACSELRAACG